MSVSVGNVSAPLVALSSESIQHRRSVRVVVAETVKCEDPRLFSKIVTEPLLVITYRRDGRKMCGEMNVGQRHSAEF